jgi:cell division protein FtsW
MTDKKPFDFWIFITVLILLSLGTIMVFSSSAAYAYSNLNGDAYFFLKKQLIYAPLSIVAMLITMRIDYRKLGKLSPILLVISIVLLIMVAIPGIGTVQNGAQRWLILGGQSLQPSEIAKVAVILFFAQSLSKRKDQLQYFLKGLMPYLLVVGLFAGLLMLEPHFSCTLIITLVACIILFTAGAKISHFILLALPAIPALIAMVILAPYRLARVVSFIDPFKDARGQGWQVIQSLYAIGSGGLFGKGIGKSLQKFLYIPEPYNDFIFSVLAEELGFIGVLAVMILFIIFIWRGIKISMNAQDVMGSLIAVGITSMVAVEVIINIAVVTSSMPATGMPLPFFSYGGTSLIILMSEIGVLLNISKYAKYERI